MLFGADTKELFPLKTLDGAGRKKLLELNVLGGTDTKKLFSLKMLDGAGIKKTPLIQYVRRYWHKKAASTENARRGCYKRNSSNPKY